jgi:hypothetical protein
LVKSNNTEKEVRFFFINLFIMVWVSEELRKIHSLLDIFLATNKALSLL